MSVSLSLAWVPYRLRGHAEVSVPIRVQALAVFSGVTLLTILAQVAVPLAWTPVPITGQTFAVALLSLLWGRRLGMFVMLGYLGSAAVGLPVLAQGGRGLSWGPTLGYLVGMLLATQWVGFLADRGWARRFATAWLAAASGSVLVFACGLFVLKFFVPSGTLAAGLWPFLPGDFVKNLLAASVAVAVNKWGKT